MTYYNLNWYKFSQDVENLNREASIKDWIPQNLLNALIAVLTGTSILSSAQQNQVSEEDIQKALNNKEIITTIQQTIQTNNAPKPYKQINNQLNINDIKIFIEKHEGKRNSVYLDSKGIETIGIGFNLRKPSAKSLINAVGANYSNILAGKEKLTNDQIYKLFNLDVQTAINDARKIFSNFNSLPNDIQKVLVDMSFNLGYSKLSGFIKLKTAIENLDFVTAAKEMKNSKWYTQVGNRSIELVNLMTKNQTK